MPQTIDLTVDSDDDGEADKARMEAQSSTATTLTSPYSSALKTPIIKSEPGDGTTAQPTITTTQATIPASTTASSIPAMSGTPSIKIKKEKNPPTKSPPPTNPPPNDGDPSIPDFISSKSKFSKHDVFVGAGKWGANIRAHVSNKISMGFIVKEVPTDSIVHGKIFDGDVLVAIDGVNLIGMDYRKARLLLKESMDKYKLIGLIRPIGGEEEPPPKKNPSTPLPSSSSSPSTIFSTPLSIPGIPQPPKPTPKPPTSKPLTLALRSLQRRIREIYWVPLLNMELFHVTTGVSCTFKMKSPGALGLRCKRCARKFPKEGPAALIPESVETLATAFKEIATGHIPICAYLNPNAKGRLNKAKDTSVENVMEMEEYFGVLVEKYKIVNHGKYIGFETSDKKRVDKEKARNSTGVSNPLDKKSKTPKSTPTAKPKTPDSDTSKPFSKRPSPSSSQPPSPSLSSSSFTSSISAMLNNPHPDLTSLASTPNTSSFLSALAPGLGNSYSFASSSTDKQLSAQLKLLLDRSCLKNRPNGLNLGGFVRDPTRSRSGSMEEGSPFAPQGVKKASAPPLFVGKQERKEEDADADEAMGGGKQEVGNDEAKVKDQGEEIDEDEEEEELATVNKTIAIAPKPGKTTPPENDERNNTSSPEVVVTSVVPPKNPPKKLKTKPSKSKRPLMSYRMHLTPPPNLDILPTTCSRSQIILPLTLKKRPTPPPRIHPSRETFHKLRRVPTPPSVRMEGMAVSKTVAVPPFMTMGLRREKETTMGSRGMGKVTREAATAAVPSVTVGRGASPMPSTASSLVARMSRKEETERGTSGLAVPSLPAMIPRRNEEKEKKVVASVVSSAVVSTSRRDEEKEKETVAAASHVSMGKPTKKSDEILMASRRRAEKEEEMRVAAAAMASAKAVTASAKAVTASAKTVTAPVTTVTSTSHVPLEQPKIAAMTNDVTNDNPPPSLESLQKSSSTATTTKRPAMESSGDDISMAKDTEIVKEAPKMTAVDTSVTITDDVTAVTSPTPLPLPPPLSKQPESVKESSHTMTTNDNLTSPPPEPPPAKSSPPTPRTLPNNSPSPPPIKSPSPPPIKSPSPPPTKSPSPIPPTSLHPPPTPLVYPSDATHISSFIFLLLQQVQPCTPPTPTSPPRIGIECQYCHNHPDAFQLYPSSVRRFRTCMTQMHAHLMSCKRAGFGLKRRLCWLKEQETSQYTKIKPSWQNAFYDRVWERLARGGDEKEEKDEDEKGDKKEEEKEEETKSAKGAAMMIGSTVVATSAKAAASVTTENAIMTETTTTTTTTTAKTTAKTTTTTARKDEPITNDTTPSMESNTQANESVSKDVISPPPVLIKKSRTPPPAPTPTSPPKKPRLENPSPLPPPPPPIPFKPPIILYNPSVTPPPPINNPSKLPPLVSIHDKNQISEFVFLLLEQVQPCPLSDMSLSPPHTRMGIECLHCNSDSDPFKLFPTSVRRFRTCITQMHDHIMRCKKAPLGLKERLILLKDQETREYTKIKPSRQDEFYDKVWERLSGKMIPTEEAAVRRNVKKIRLDTFPFRASARMKSKSLSMQMPRRDIDI